MPMKHTVTPELEQKYLNEGYSSVVGIDEVGRGCWAGPVVVVAFSFDEKVDINPLVNDSKKLTLKRTVQDLSYCTVFILCGLI